MRSNCTQQTARKLAKTYWNVTKHLQMLHILLQQTDMTWLTVCTISVSQTLCCHHLAVEYSCFPSGLEGTKWHTDRTQEARPCLSLPHTLSEEAGKPTHAGENTQTPHKKNPAGILTRAFLRWGESARLFLSDSHLPLKLINRVNKNQGGKRVEDQPPTANAKEAQQLSVHFNG